MGSLQLLHVSSYATPFILHLPPSPSAHTKHPSFSHLFSLKGSDFCNLCFRLVPDISRNAYTRGLAHIASVSAPHNPQTTHRDGKPVPKSTLKHHVDTVHATDSTPPAFKMRVTGVYGGDATKRLVSE